MKKLAITFVLLITVLFGNPIDPTQFYINEVFIQDDNWVIELPTTFKHTQESFYDYINDTLIVKNESDSIFYPVNKIKFYNEYCCLCSDSINQPFYLNPVDEMLSLEMKDTMIFSYHSELNWNSNEFSFSENPAIIPGASLSRENDNLMFPEFLFKYYLDLSPTIGSKNDSINAIGSLIISIYDSCGNYMPAEINSLGISGYISGQKEFSVLASKYTLIAKPYYSNNFEDFLFQEIIVMPDSTVYSDFVFPIKYTSVEKTESILDKFTLSQNYPNPFNPSTTFSYNIPIKSYVELKVFDLQGKLVEKLVNEVMEPGEYNRIWNATKYPSGVYIYQLQTNSITLQKKCLLVK